MTISIKATRGNSGSGDPTSISGPTVIIKGAINTYTITDYDSFSVYEVTSSAGTVSRTNETITLMVATDEVNNTLQLTVSRDGNIVVKNIAIGAQVIATPNITSPASGSVDVSIPTSLLATAFTSYPTGADTHVSSDWRVKNTAGEIVWQSLSNTVDKTSITIPASNLAPGTQYFAEVRYNGNVLGSSSYSPPVQFTTSVVFIVRPSITSPVSGATGVAATPTFVATAFATNPVGSDTHASSDWRLKDSLGAIIWSSNTDTVNKTSITLPSGVLAVSSQYTMEVRYNGNVLQPSQWSPVVSFTTAAQFSYEKYLTTAGTGNPFLNTYGQDVDTFTKLPNPAGFVNAVGNSAAYTVGGAYLAVGINSAPYLTIYKRDGDELTIISNPDIPPAGRPADLSWSSDGVYLAVGHANAPFITIYKRVGDTLTKLANPGTLPSGSCSGVAFSPDGSHLIATSLFTGAYIYVYKRTGDTLNYLGANIVATVGAKSPCISDDGVYLAVLVSTGSVPVVIYKRTGDSYTRLADPTNLPSSVLNSLSFAPNSAYLATAGSSTAGAAACLLKRSGDTFTRIADPQPSLGGTALCTAFSADGNYLAYGLDSGTASVRLVVYKKSGDDFNKLADVTSGPTGSVNAITFYPPVPGA